MIRVVLDTNVIVSALLFGGELGCLVEWWRLKRILPCITRETFSELRTVLSYPKFKLSADEIRFLISEEILPHFEAVIVKEPVRGVSRDAADDQFLAAAHAAGAAYLVAGDSYLLDLEKFGQTVILPCREFIRRVRV